MEVDEDCLEELMLKDMEEKEGKGGKGGKRSHEEPDQTGSKYLKS